MATQKTLDDLFLDTLKDIYYAEKQIVKALRRNATPARMCLVQGLMRCPKSSKTRAL